MPQGKFALTIVVLLLLVMPLIGESLATRREASEVLESAGDYHECLATAPCLADFDGDGVDGHASIVTLKEMGAGSYNRAVIVVDRGRELLWQPFYHAVDAPPTRLGVRRVGATERLLVYDGMTGLSRAVFAFDTRHERMSWATPSEEDRRIFDLMERYDSDLIVGARTVEPAPDSDMSVLKLTLYYLALCALAAVLLYRKSLRMSAAIPLNPRGGNP